MKSNIITLDMYRWSSMAAIPGLLTLQVETQGMEKYRVGQQRFNRQNASDRAM
jgi:hypothetical protein